MVVVERVLESHRVGLGGDADGSSILGLDGRSCGGASTIGMLALLNGLDDVALTLQKSADIETFEGGQKSATPWLYG